MRPTLIPTMTVAIITFCVIGTAAQDGGSGQQAQMAQRRAGGSRQVPDAPVVKPTYTKAVKVSERALASLMAWRLRDGGNILENNRQELGETPEFKTAQGYLKACHGEYNDAIAVLQSASNSNKADPAPPYYHGLTLWWQEKYDAAESAWKTSRDRAQRLVDENALDSRAQHYLGAALVHLKSYAPGREALGKAADFEISTELVNYEIGLSYFLEERWQQAVDSLDLLAKADPRFAHLYFYRGIAWGQLDRKDKMMNDMEQFIALAPDSPEARTANAYLSAGAR